MALPSVSIIIPVLNAERDIRTALESLMALDYPRELIEIIVVDNGSTDRTREVVRDFPVALMVEDSAKNAYTARNAAIRRAKGEIIAFTDGDCIIDPHWLKASIGALETRHADLVGGNITFTFPEGMTAACVVDSMINLRNDTRIPSRQCAVTANLVVRASLFQSVGLFPDVWPVAGDIIWTTRASAAGRGIVYAPDAIVHHPARGFKPLLHKTYSIAIAFAYQHREVSGSKAGSREVMRLLKTLIPPNPYAVWRQMRKRGIPRPLSRVIPVWSVMYIHSVVRATAALKSIFKNMQQPVQS